MRSKLVFCAGLALMLAATLGPARADGVLELGVDDAGDWGANFDPEVHPIGDAAGADVVSAAVDLSDPAIMNLLIRVTNLPENGGVPEGMRYLWELRINGEHRELDGKFLNYTRGACDPTSGQCPPPRDPGPAPFILRGRCVSNGAFNACEELAVVNATFDTETDTISVPVPVSALGPDGCYSVEPGENSASFPGETIIVIPSAFASQATLPHDGVLLEHPPFSVGDC